MTKPYQVEVMRHISGGSKCRPIDIFLYVNIPTRNGDWRRDACQRVSTSIRRRWLLDRQFDGWSGVCVSNIAILFGAWIHNYLISLRIQFYYCGWIWIVTFIVAVNKPRFSNMHINKAMLTMVKLWSFDKTPTKETYKSLWKLQNIRSIFCSFHMAFLCGKKINNFLTL